MNSFTKKEQEQIKRFEQLRRQLQMIFIAHIRLIVFLFIASLTLIMTVIYVKWFRSPKRYEAQVMIHYSPPDRGDRSRTMDPKLVLEILQRIDTSRSFYKKIGSIPGRWKPWQCQIRIEPIEKNRVMDRFKVLVTAPEERTAVTLANAFAKHCVETYTRENPLLLEKQRRELKKQISGVQDEIARIEDEKKQLCEGKNILDPKSEFVRLERGIHDATREMNKEAPEFKTRKNEYDALSAEMKNFNPALIENEGALRERIAARKKLDDEIEKNRSEYLDTNPKMINLKERRTAIEASFQKFLKEKNLRESELNQLDAAIKLHAALVKSGADLKVREEKMRTFRNVIKSDEEKLAYLRQIMPQIDKLNELQRTQRESLNKLNASISDIDTKLPVLKENMRIGYRGSPKKLKPFGGNKIVLCIIGALVITLVLAALAVMFDFIFGVVSSEKELMLFSELHYLGALPTREDFFESATQAQIVFNSIYHAFMRWGSDHHVVLASTLPGGKLLPGLFNHFENFQTMNGKRMLCIDVVLAENFNYDTPCEFDTGIIYCSGSKGHLPVISKKFLSPSECELLRNDLLLLRNTYDLIFIRHSVSMRRDRMFVEQIIPLCDCALVSVGFRRTSRKNLRRIAAINRKTNLPIMSILSDDSPKAVGKHNNLELEG